MCERVRSYNIIHSCSELASITQGDIATTTRRRMLQLISVTSPLFTSLCVSTPGLAADMTKTTTATTTNLQSGGAAGILVDLPPDAVRSYLQYRIPLQTSADFYLFELHDLLSNTNEWGQIADLFTMNNSRGGQGSPSRMERDFTNTFRILGLSMPPDASEELREAQFRFEAAAAKIAKVKRMYTVVLARGELYSGSILTLLFQSSRQRHHHSYFVCCELIQHDRNFHYHILYHSMTFDRQQPVFDEIYQWKSIKMLCRWHLRHGMKDAERSMISLLY